MSARILDGREVAARIRLDLSERVQRLVDADRSGSSAPRLAIIRAGGSEEAGLYAASLERSARSVGMPSEVVTAADGPLEAVIRRLNEDPSVAGVVLAQPLEGEDPRLVDLLDPAKDVDGATPTSAGRLARGEPAFVPATALAVVAILEAFQIDVAGLHAVIVGRSAVVGRPVASLLLARDATGTVCHRQTRDLPSQTRRGDLLVAAAGVAGLVTAEMVEPGAIVVDCGINATNGRVVGDVDFDAVAPAASAITPVPGGVGPVTPMMVLRQAVESAERRAGIGFRHRARGFSR